MLNLLLDSSCGVLRQYCRYIEVGDEGLDLEKGDLRGLRGELLLNKQKSYISARNDVWRKRRTHPKITNGGDY